MIKENKMLVKNKKLSSAMFIEAVWGKRTLPTELNIVSGCR
jgi:hypothetical protein